MSAAALASIVALDAKAGELMDKQHFERALEKQQAAVAAAQALGNEPDCLITALLQAHEGECRFRKAFFSAVLSPGPERQEIPRAIQTMIVVMSALKRRKAAGTLLPGTCRKVEVEWKALLLPSQVETLDAFGMREYLTLAKPFVGYETYLVTASMTLRYCFASTDGWEFEAIKYDVVELLEFSTGAVQLLALPRGEFPLKSELRFNEAMHLFHTFGVPDQPAKQRLLEAWNRLERSNVLSRRGLNRSLAEQSLRHEFVSSLEQEAARAAETLLSCALPSCGAPEAHAAHFKRCAACKAAAYCCREHQVQDWPAHKAACKAARKEAKPAAASSP